MSTSVSEEDLDQWWNESTRPETNPTTVAPSHEQWLTERRKGIGSSDAAQICGLSEWGSPLSVYLDKLGLLPPRESPEKSWGLRLENVIADAYCDETGHDLIGPIAQLQNQDMTWMIANVDRMRDHDRGIVELKTSRTSHGWGEEGTDQIPQAYLIQVQHQMAVVGAEIADVAVLIGGSDFRIYTVPRSKELIDRLIKIERDFWNQVECRIPPPADWTDPRTPELIALLHRPTEGKEIELSLHDSALVEEYTLLGEAAKKADKKRAEIKGRLIERLGDAELGLLPDGGRIRRKQVHRKAYEVGASSYFNFLISPGKGS